MDDAVRGGNLVRAVVRGTLGNQDREGEGLVAPDALAREALIRSFYKMLAYLT